MKISITPTFLTSPKGSYTGNTFEIVWPDDWRIPVQKDRICMEPFGTFTVDVVEFVLNKDDVDHVHLRVVKP